MIAESISVLIQIAAFLALWFLLSRLLFRPFLGLLEEREKRTEGTQEEAETLIAETERLRADYENRMTRARADADTVKRAILADAGKAREEILARARENAQELLLATRRQLASEMEGARALIA